MFRGPEVSQSLHLLSLPFFNCTKLFSASEISPVKTGGKILFFKVVENLRELSDLLGKAKKFGLPALVVGECFNTIFATELFKGLVLKLGSSFNYIKINSTVVEAGASTPLPLLLKVATLQGLSGLEFSAGIPGSLGGAVKGNAGAFGKSFADVVKEVEIFHENKLERLGAARCGFGYRQSKLKGVVTRVWLELKKSSTEKIKKTIEKLLSERRNKQPAEPSLGCVFKNPPGAHAGQLIEKAGLKGKSAGRVKVSEKHANFVVFNPPADWRDFLSLIRLIEERVKNEFGIRLEREVVVVEGTSIDGR